MIKLIRLSSFSVFTFFMLLTSASASGITINPGAKVTLNGSQITTQDIEVKPGGSLEANSGAMSLFGNWQNQGTFTSGTSTVTFLGSSPSFISGTNTFYKLSCTTPGKQLNFAASQKQTITNKLTLTGALNNLILLRSTTPGTQWQLDPQGERSVNYVDVQDAYNRNSSLITVTNYKDSGNNLNWSFASPIPKIIFDFPQNVVFYVNDILLITPTVTTNDPSPLRYQFSVDGIVTQAWSLSAIYRWELTLPGLHTLKVEVKNAAGSDSKQVEVNIYRKPPLINFILPDNNSVFLAGAKINIQTNASDPDNDPLQYQFSIGGTVKQTWSSVNTYIWQTSSADKGAVSITCEVKDSNSDLTSKTISISILDPTIQEILKKVADNYAKISDFSADMTLSSTLDAKPFGATDYCRYYFQAPNKEKTETFNDSTRKVKNDIIIINGTNMYLINPIENKKQTVDLLADAGVSSTEFGQLDLYYNQTLFLSKNTVSRNGLNTDFNNMIIALDVSSNEKNNIYDKLSILIDYNKGLITKFSIYRINQASTLELVQETTAVDFQKMPNDAWLPVKMAKTPNLASGKLISTLIYNNLKINQNLSDDIFDPDKQ